MDKEEIKPVKKRSVWDSFTYVYLGFLAICSIAIIFLAYNKDENIVAIVFSFIAGVLLAMIGSINRSKDIG